MTEVQMLSGGVKINTEEFHKGQVQPGDWFDPWVRKIPWRRAWQPTLAFLPGESLWTGETGGLQSTGRRESDTTKQLSKHSREDYPPVGWVRGAGGGLTVSSTSRVTNVKASQLAFGVFEKQVQHHLGDQVGSGDRACISPKARMKAELIPWAGENATGLAPVQ